jgi:hypothetical protein
MNVPPGKSVSHAEVSDEIIQPATTSRPSNNVELVQKPPKQKKEFCQIQAMMQIQMN